MIPSKKEPGTYQDPKNQERQKTAMENHPKREEVRGQLSPHGSGHGPDPEMNPYRTSEKADGRRTMLPLQGARTSVPQLPQKGKWPTTILENLSHDNTKCGRSLHVRSGNRQNQNRGRKNRLPGGGTKRTQR